jgi:nuclear transcription factor Y gamma
MDHPDNISTPQRMSMPSSEQQTIDEFWRKKQDEIEAIEDFSKRVIPMTCLKKVLCAEKGKMMMTFDTPSFVTKACEIFVQELSLRSWMCANSHHRDIILDSDIAEAIASMESYDFLNDVLCKYQGEHNSAHHPKSIKKHSHNRLTDQPQTSSHPRSNKYPIPQFISQSARYPPFALPPPLPATNDYHVPLPLRFLPQEACPLMATTITQTPVLGGTIHHLPNIPNEGYMSTTPSMDTYYVDSASKNNVVCQDELPFCSSSCMGIIIHSTSG